VSAIRRARFGVVLRLAAIAPQCRPPDGTILWATRGGLTFLGYDARVVGRHIVDFHVRSESIAEHSREPAPRREVIGRELG